MAPEFDPRWDERFSQPGFFYGTEPNDFLRDHAQVFKPGGKILCLGEGEGRNSVYLAQKGFEVTAVDWSSKAFDKLSQLEKERKVEVKKVVSDLADFPIGKNEWDGIISIWCHLSKDLWRELFQKITAGLKPNGLFLLEHYTPKQLQFKTGGPPTADLMTTLQELKTELKTLEILVGQEIERDIQEGKGHFGQSAVVQYLGRKSQ
jgi:SAM-dependent methyltransferase